MTTLEIVRWVIDTFEGRLYTDDPVDSGGATKFGITLRTLQYARRKWLVDPNLIVTTIDVQNLTIDEAVRVGVEVFAVETKINQLVDSRVQLVVYDYGFHSGQPRAIKALQTEIGMVNPDGQLGSLTLDRVNAVADPRLVALQVLTAREEFMQGIMMRDSVQRKWMLGWWNRTTKLQRLVIS